MFPSYSACRLLLRYRAGETRISTRFFLVYLITSCSVFHFRRSSSPPLVAIRTEKGAVELTWHSDITERILVEGNTKICDRWKIFIRWALITYSLKSKFFYLTFRLFVCFLLTQFASWATPLFSPYKKSWNIFLITSGLYFLIRTLFSLQCL